MSLPGPELRPLLTRTEWLAVRLADACARRAPWLNVLFRDALMGPLIWVLAVRRRLRLRGVEHLRAVPPAAPLLLVANHRSFFDFFVITAALRFRAGFRRPLFFPVRAEFFYDHPLGVAVNALAAGMSMFPPLFRRGPRRVLNDWSLVRAAELLASPGRGLGLHPEGTRHRGADPLDLLPARSGVGRVALAVPGVRVLPVFALGLGNAAGGEIAANLFSPAAHPIDIAIGPAIELSDLRAAASPEAPALAAERFRAAILDLGRGLPTTRMAG